MRSRSILTVVVVTLLLLILRFTIQPSYAQSQPTTAPPSTSIVFENVRIFDGKSAQVSGPTNLLVVDNKIQTISTAGVSAPSGTKVTRIKGGGRVLMPGLIDNHVHLYMTASTKEQLLSPSVSPAILDANMTAEAKQMLLRGFTTVRDMGGPVFGLKAAIDQGKTIGPRIYPSGGTISQTSGHGDFRDLSERSRRFGGKISRAEELGATFIADGRDEVLTATRENLRFGASQIKVMAGGGVASAYDPLDVAEYTFDELKAAVDAADDWNTYVTVHAYTPKAVRRSIDAGVKCIEHGQLLNEATMKYLAEKGVWLSLQSLDPAPPTASLSTRTKKQEVVEGTDNAFKWARQYNVNLAWGTDFLFAPAQNAKQNADILKLTKWMSPAEALKMVTYDNGRLLTLSGPRNPYPGKLGVVERGAYADLILVDGNPLQNLDLVADYTNKFKVIVKDGKIYKNTV